MYMKGKEFETILYALKFLDSLESKTGYITRANFNAMLDLLETQVGFDADDAFIVARSSANWSIDDSNDSDSLLSYTDKLLSTNNAIVNLLDYAKSVDKNTQKMVISRQDLQTIVFFLDIESSSL